MTPIVPLCPKRNPTERFPTAIVRDFLYLSAKSTEMSRKTFEQWRIGELHHAFGLTRHYKGFDLLETWLTSQHPISEADRSLLEELKEELAYNADLWNEDELKFFFISPLIQVCRLKSEHYKIFTQRRVSATLNDVKLSGVVDFVIAQGIDEPERPFFFLHEYKQEKKRTNDPLAQVLSAMLAAQALNQAEFPLYGCYVQGRFWFFVVLQGTDYAVSDAFTATQDDLFQVVSILREGRQRVLAQVGDSV